MTVLGLNAILLASRMGSEGRAMVEVAQQLRGIARSITERISLLRQDTEGIAATAESLNAPEDKAPAEPLLAAVEATAQVSELARSVGRQLGEMAAARPAADTAEAFRCAEQDLSDFAGLVEWLGGVANRFDNGSSSEPSLSSGTTAIIAEVRGFYVMQSERDIHDTLFPELGVVVEAEDVQDLVLFALRTRLRARRPGTGRLVLK